MKPESDRKFNQLYAAHRTAVYHMALVYVGEPAAAEDVLQEVFLSLLETLRGGETLRHPRAWLLTATRNRSCNCLRDGKREQPVDELPGDWIAGPEEDGDLRVLWDQLSKELSREEWLCFSLHCLDRYTYREIAQGLDLPQGTVQTRCRAARQKLKAALRREENCPLPEEKGVNA